MSAQQTSSEKPATIVIVTAFLFSTFVLVLGYILLGLLPTFLFAFGFMGGFALWLMLPRRFSFREIALWYFLTLALFVLHKWEERVMDFFPKLSEITGVPVPDTNSVGVYLLYAAAGLWLLIPILVAKGYAFGHYLSWTFFTSMGVIELAHFAFPLFMDKPYGYFPGMASVIVLAPAAWIGLYLMAKRSKFVN